MQTGKFYDLRNEMKQEPEENKSGTSTINTGSGLAIGVALGVVFGVIFDQIALGIVFGAAFGLVFGGAMGRQNSTEANDSEET
jgi:hypothetical protein